jgi:hypothetical protein
VSSEDRRLFPRLKASVFFREARSQYFGAKRQPLNVSLGGFRIYSDEAMRVGQKLELDLLLPSGETVACEAAVAWIRELPKGDVAAFDVGLSFVGASRELKEKLSSVLEPTEDG